MKILFLIILLVFSGCATVSDYNQGCRDGIGSVRISGVGPLGDEKSINGFCDSLDSEHQNKKADHHK